MSDLHEQALALCHAIERIPASEEQTEASVLAAALADAISRRPEQFTPTQIALLRDIGVRVDVYPATQLAWNEAAHIANKAAQRLRDVISAAAGEAQPIGPAADAVEIRVSIPSREEQTP